jgi:hypothetical protein
MMTVTDAALRAVAANATRHLFEADQHYKDRRYPSATASAVLSIEEAGKLSYITAHGSVPKEKRHAAHAMLFVALLKGLAQWDWTAEWARTIREGADLTQLGLTARQQHDVAAHSELAEFVRRLHAGELGDLTERVNTWAAAAIAKEQREGTFKFWDSLFTQGLQAIRLKATYVDVTASGEIQTDPNTIDDEFARFMCTGAVGFLVLALMLAMHTRKSLDLRDLLQAVPNDLTGWDVLYNALCKVLPTLAAQAEAAGNTA